MDADKFLMIGDTTYEVTERHTSNEYAPPKRRSRRGSGSHTKRLRDSHGRNRVLEERREREERAERRRTKPTPPEKVMWREFMEETRENAQRENPPTIEGWEVRDGTRGDARVTRVKRVDTREFQPTPRHLIGVETHPVPEFAKSRDYHHQPLENPTHLWCDVTHATDADVMRGNRKG